MVENCPTDKLSVSSASALPLDVTTGLSLPLQFKCPQASKLVPPPSPGSLDVGRPGQEYVQVNLFEGFTEDSSRQRSESYELAKPAVLNR